MTSTVTCSSALDTARSLCEPLPNNEYFPCRDAADKIYNCCAYNICSDTSDTSAATAATVVITPGPRSSGMMYEKGLQGVKFGPYVASTAGGAALVFELTADPHCQSTSTPDCAYKTHYPTMDTCAIDAASALSAEVGAPSRVYCFQQTTDSGLNDKVYMAKCTDTDTALCPTLPAS